MIRQRGPTARLNPPLEAELSPREQIDRLYDKARALGPEGRTAFVDNACRHTPELGDEVLSLLEQTEAAEEFFRSLSEIMPTPAPFSPSPDLAIGHKVSHYEILERIGSGGMGTVYRVQDTRLAREVALKFLPPHLTADPEAREGLFTEARAAAALGHPNVCTVHEIGETADGHPFIAMAFCEGDTLKDRLSEGPLPPAEAVLVVSGIARGLAAAHARGIVHRDVKPGNVMFASDGTVKLLDFGLARVADATLTRPGATPGTLAYMSPEQARGDPLDHRTDLWSLGVVLYEMLAGVRPFRGGNDRALIQAILHDEPEPFSKVRPETPEPLSRIVERLLGKEPADRYGSADELLADLAEPTSARARPRPALPGATSIPVVGPWIARLSARQVAGGVAFVLAGVALPYVVQSARDNSDTSTVANGTGGAPAIAVLPFSVHGQDLEVWREGMVDLLSIDLDGVGNLRAIDSRTLLARWNEEVGDEERADLGASLEVARRTRATYALVGSAVEAGPEIRLAADVYDLGSGRSLGQVVVEGSPDSVLALVDRLGMKILGVIFEGSSASLPAIELASVTTSSLPALKAYLNGEVRFRRSDYKAAIAAWERAVAADTLFALAYVGLTDAYAWDEGGEGRSPSEAWESLDRARRLTSRLPDRVATQIEVKWAQWYDSPGHLAAAQKAVREYPDDAEAWYNLGEDYFHKESGLASAAEAEHAFRRAAELQPGSAPYRSHLIDLAFHWRPDSAWIAQEIEAFRRLAPHGQRTRTGRIALALAFGAPGDRARAREELTHLDPGSAFQVYSFLRHPGFAEAREAVQSAIEARLDDRRLGLYLFWRFHDLGLGQGRLREALSILDEPGTPDIVRFCWPAFLAGLGFSVPERVLREAVAASPADTSSSDAPNRVTCAARHAAHRGRWDEHAALLSQARTTVAQERSSGDSASAWAWDETVRETEAHGLWRKGRRAEALQALESLLARHSEANWVVWHVGQVAFELDRLDVAERAFRALWREPLAYLYLGRIYERTDRPAEALKAYNFFASAWHGADPELQPLVDEARRGVARLKA